MKNQQGLDDGAGRASLLRSCFEQIRRWRVPPNWAPQDWFDQMKAHVASAAWEAERDYDSSRGVPLSAFMYARVMASARTQYRREWRYALRCVSGIREAGQTEESKHGVRGVRITPEWLPITIALLPDVDRWLIQQLFWLGLTQAEVARQMGVSQPAVSKRKRAIIRKLLLSLDSKKKRRNGC